MRLTGELEGSSAAFGSGLQLGHEVHQCAAPLTLACGAFSAHIFTGGESICLPCAQAPWLQSHRAVSDTR